MKIDKRLNLIVPIYGDAVAVLDAKGAPVFDDQRQPKMTTPVVAHVHSQPLSEEVVDLHFMTLAQTYSAIFSRGLGMVGGPAIAMRLLRTIAMENGVWEDSNGQVGVKNGLVEEIRRLTTVVVPNPTGGWQQVPLQVAVDGGNLSTEDRTEVENAIVFFIAASAVLNRSMRRPMLEAAAELWGAHVSSSTSTELASSLGTSTVTGSSGAKSPAPARHAGAGVNATVDGKPSSVPR